MWRQIRGQGLAYSYSIVAKPNEAKLFLYFYRASNIVATYKEARNVIVSYNYYIICLFVALVVIGNFK